MADKPAEDGTQQMYAVSLNMLVQLATDVKAAKSDLPAQIILTYRSFTSPAMLMKKLAVRYKVGESSSMSPGDQAFVRSRVVNLIRLWLYLCPSDFDDHELRKMLLLFIHSCIKSREGALELLRDLKKANDQVLVPLSIVRHRTKRSRKFSSVTRTTVMTSVRAP